MTLIKTCGLFRREDIEAVNDARPDFAGFVVNFPTSHRNVSPEQVCKLRADLRGDIEAVGVFVNEDPQVIASLVERRGIDIVQLHGSEDEAYIESLRALCDVPIIKAFKIHKWHDRYQPKMEIFDGDSWSIYFKYGSDKSKGSGGYMAWPDNYHAARQAISEYFQKWRDYPNAEKDDEEVL